MKTKAALIGITLAAMTGSFAQATDCGLQQCWGAVAFGPGGAYGWSHSMSTEHLAREAAKEGCEFDCTEIKTFFNACESMAVASDGAWGWGVAQSHNEAENIALKYCREYGPECKTRVWACSQ